MEALQEALCCDIRMCHNTSLFHLFYWLEPVSIQKGFHSSKENRPGVRCENTAYHTSSDTYIQTEQ